MRRGVSPIIATILILVVTVAIAAGLLAWLMSIQSKVQQQTSVPTIYTISVIPETAKATSSPDGKINVTFNLINAGGQVIPTTTKLVVSAVAANGTAVSKVTNVGAACGGKAISPGEEVTCSVILDLPNRTDVFPITVTVRLIESNSVTFRIETLSS